MARYVSLIVLLVLLAAGCQPAAQPKDTVLVPSEVAEDAYLA